MHTFKAATTLRNSLQKAEGGEGSRGGRIIGHYRGGGPIYASGKNESKNVFSHPAARAANLGNIHNQKVGDNLSTVAQIHRDHFRDHTAKQHELVQSAHTRAADKLSAAGKADSSTANAHRRVAAFHRDAAAYVAGKK